MSNTNKQLEDTFKTIPLLTGPSVLGFYCYWTSKCQERNKSKKKKEKVTDKEGCPICFEKMTNHCTTFGCQHSFHKKCIAQWEVISRTCPICRLPIDK